MATWKWSLKVFSFRCGWPQIDFYMVYLSSHITLKKKKKEMKPQVGFYLLFKTLKTKIYSCYVYADSWNINSQETVNKGKVEYLHLSLASSKSPFI